MRRGYLAHNGEPNSIFCKTKPPQPTKPTPSLSITYHPLPARSAQIMPDTKGTQFDRNSQCHMPLNHRNHRLERQDLESCIYQTNCLPTGTDRVNRGGSVGSPAANERSAARAKPPQIEASAYRGFRLALGCGAMSHSIKKRPPVSGRPFLLLILLWWKLSLQQRQHILRR